MTDFVKIAPQCCDAYSYVGHGQECAFEGKCFGDLRPAGDYYWFSIPQRLDWPLETLVWVNIAVLLLCGMLGALALSHLMKHWQPLAPGRERLRRNIIWSVTLPVHAVFFLPTLFNTLSDPPASGLLLCGVWLLILAALAPQPARRASAVAAAALCWGMAAWLRAFFLYPVLAGTTVLLLSSLLAPSWRRWAWLCLLALLPIGSQYYTMLNAYGSVSYLNPETTKGWSDMHLNQPFVGYDTVFPRNGQFWTPTDCQAERGILNGLQDRDFASLACVLRGRLNFYLGTYEPTTYHFTNLTNKLVRELVESVGDTKTGDWWTKDLQFEKDVAVSPAGHQSADRLTVTQTDPEGAGDIAMWVMLRGERPHTFSVWLWSPLPRTINIAITSQLSDFQVAERQVTLTPEPQRYSVTGLTGATAEYNINIGKTPYRTPMSFGTQPGDFFYVWGAQLEEGSSATTYNPDEKLDPASVRQPKPWLFYMNVLAIVLVMIAVLRNAPRWVKSPSAWAILAVAGVAAAECLAIIPEQRFAIVPMTLLWLSCGMVLLSAWSQAHVISAGPGKTA